MTPRILLVDDDAMLLRATLRTLRKTGAEIVTAVSLNHAQHLVGFAGYDALLTDWHLGDGIGPQVVAAWVKAGYDKDSAIIWSGDPASASQHHHKVWDKAEPDKVIAEIQRMIEGTT